MSALPRDVLVVAPSWVGDAVMATPAFRALRGAWPQARIVLACRPGIDQVFGGLSAFDDTIVSNERGMLGPWRAAVTFRQRRFDCAVLFPNSFRVALAAWLARIPRRIGYARDGRAILLTNRVTSPPRSTPTPAVDAYCELVEQGCAAVVSDRAPALALTEGDSANAARVLDGISARYAVLVPGANRADKRWPAERFARVAEHLAKTHGLAAIAVASPGERDIIAALRSAATVEVIDGSNRGLDLGALKAIIAGAKVVISNDTGPRHIAAAFRVPTVSLFGPTDHRWTTLPSANERVIVAEPFLPEELVADDRAKFCAIERISVGDVVAACDALLTAPRR